jgi:4-diphosphocytidyl-2C-methyl-D-erythritol kinase
MYEGDSYLFKISERFAKIMSEEKGVEVMEIIEKAPAKINLLLDVVGKREDGFHEMELVMTSIDLSDRLTISPREDEQITISSNSAFMPLDERNIVHKTAKLFKDTYTIQQGIHIDIHKKIPIAAGLGGGSSDAAAVLRGLNRLWKLDITTEELAGLGSQIGSDVPFCVYGRTAYASGRGDEVELIQEIPQCWVVLVKPPKGISSWTVFENLDVDQLVHLDSEKMLSAIKECDYEGVISSAGNALEEISALQQPLITRVKEKMLEFGADTAVMSGTGPTIYALTQKHSKAKRIVNGLKGFCQEVYLVRTLK